MNAYHDLSDLGVGVEERLLEHLQAVSQSEKLVRTGRAGGGGGAGGMHKPPCESGAGRRWPLWAVCGGLSWRGGVSGGVGGLVW